jgi:transcription elongation factor S-II
MLKISNPDFFRNNIRTKLNVILDDEKKTNNLEKGVFNYSIKEAETHKIIKKWENPYFCQIYIDKLRSIYINLKNNDFLLKIKSGEILAQEVAFISHQEICPEKWTELIRKKTIKDTMKFNTNIQANCDAYKCPRCKSTRSSIYEQQTRSSDEPSTIFVLCLDCGKQYKR